ncbi:MAG: hypothetical protein M4579_002984 [Chaenotheca gracillima]|nr:MAG: hypothetical protein M4579_002984 [Chaenotheca gracillima]
MADPAGVGAAGTGSRTNGSGTGGIMTGGGTNSTINSAQASPTGFRPVSSAATASGRKRNHSIAALDSSPGSQDDGRDRDDGEDEMDRKRVPGSGPKMQHRRACNECRQQKDPWSPCDRCLRLKLDCKIENNFKRVGKRSKHAEMERDIIELRKRLAAYESPGQSTHHQPNQPVFSLGSSATASPAMYQMPMGNDQFMPSNEAVASLIDLRQGLDSSSSYLKSPNNMTIGSRKLGNTILSADHVAALFNEFVTYYHPVLPILDPLRPPEYYYDTCELLFWTVIVVAARRYKPLPQLLSSLAPSFSKMIWSTLGDIPQSYHVVKALCLICTWPLPTSSTSTDPTFMLSGVMMQIALQIGLHRPSHVQDFSRFHVKLREEELKDRVKTWATCNIVAQSVATGYGQPPSTLYDWTLESSLAKEDSYRLPAELAVRLRIEKFCDKVTQSLYSTRGDPVGLTKDDERSSLTSLLGREFEAMEADLGPDLSSINTLHLHAAGLHLRLSAFLDSSTVHDYHRDLLSLYLIVGRFLEGALSLDTHNGGVLRYATNYILQMIIAGGFALLKLLNSFFAFHIDFDRGKRLFQKTVTAIRTISVHRNDLPFRLAEVLAQLWRGGDAEERFSKHGQRGQEEDADMDSSLQLKVRCRMSMSLVFDSVWRWREEFQAKGRGTLESADKNPTNPDSAAESSASSSIVDPSLAPAASHLQPGLGGTPSMGGLMPGGGVPGSSGALTPNMANGFGDTSMYEVFDPLNWMLDGMVDFGFPTLQGTGGLQELEAQGMV